MVGLTKDAQDLAYPGYPGLTMTMSKKDHSLLYETVVGSRAGKYHITRFDISQVMTNVGEAIKLL